MGKILIIPMTKYVHVQNEIRKVNFSRPGFKTQHDAH